MERTIRRLPDRAGAPATSRAASDEDVAGRETSPAPGTGLVVKALNLIDLIAADPGKHRAQTLAEELGLPRSTVYRIINTLQQRGMVRVEASSQGYFPGFKFLEYAQAVWPLPDLPMLAMAEMRWLRDLTGETVYFGAPNGAEMVIIQKAESTWANRTGAPLGSRRPLHCTGMGKAHLAALPPGEREALLSRLSLDPVTPRTITDAMQLRSQLDVYRLRGYALDDEEFMEGVRCVSASVPGEGGSSLGALTVSGPIYRMTPERAHQLGPEIAAAAHRLGEATRRRGAARSRARPGSLQVPAFTDGHAFYGRSPLWDGPSASLVWLDAYAPALLATPGDRLGARVPSTVLARFAAPATALAPLAGGWVAIMATGAIRVDRRGDAAPYPAVPPELAAFAASAAISDGVLWIGARDGPTGPRLCRIGPEGIAEAVPLPATPTDIAIDAGGGMLYAALADAGEIVRFPIRDDRSLGPMEIVARIDLIHGRPMGLLLESPGLLWVALWDGWGIARMSLDGGDMRVLPLPVPRPTGLAFGGASGDVLFVTSARNGLAPQQIAEAPASGAVFAIDRAMRTALLR